MNLGTFVHFQRFTALLAVCTVTGLLGLGNRPAEFSGRDFLGMSRIHLPAAFLVVFLQPTGPVLDDHIIFQGDVELTGPGVPLPPGPALELLVNPLAGHFFGPDHR